MPTEADTCRTLITPKLQAAGWDTDPHSITEQRYFTDGRIVVHGNKARRRPGKKADYSLRYTSDFPIAVVEAKSEDEHAAEGMQQAKDHARRPAPHEFPHENRSLRQDHWRN
jgi:type I restriction enzyme R subunit